MTAIPVSATQRRKIEGSVVASRSICREHFQLDLILPAFAPTEPGQFVQLLCRDAEAENENRTIDWLPGTRPTFHDKDLLAPQALLARPFSLAGRKDSDNGVLLTIIHRVVGLGTTWLSRLQPGELVSVLGPLGNRFTLPPAGGTALLVGGGVGIPPMLYLADQLRSKTAIAFCGATTRDLLPLQIIDEQPGLTSEKIDPSLAVAEFADCGIRSIISTDDGSCGFHGYVTRALEKYLDQCTPDERSNFTIFTCGPELMMKRIADIANQRNIPCQVAVERAMACGMGTCQSCVIKVKTPGGWRYRLSCTDGPVFTAAELLW